MVTGFGHLDYAYTMRFVVPGATLVALGFQTVFSSFFVSILGMHRKYLAATTHMKSPGLLKIRK